MGQGLQVFNDDHIIQLDGSTPNLAFHAKGSASESVTFSCPSYPIVFVRPSRGYRMYLRSNGGDSYTYFCRGSFSYWIFTQITNPSVIGFGLQAFSETGGLVYSSHAQPLKISSVTSYSRAAAWPWRNIGFVKSQVPRVVGDHSNILPHGQFAFAVTFGSGYWARYPYGSASYYHVPILEAFEAVSRGFRIWEVQPFNEWIGPDSGVPVDWSGPPGTVVIADVSGL